LRSDAGEAAALPLTAPCATIAGWWSASPWPRIRS